MRTLTGLQKIALTTLVVVLAGGAVFFFQSQAGTTIGLVSVEQGFVCGTSTVLDADANVYDTVQIGQQCWMQQNMRVGTRVAVATTQTNNGTIEKWCYGDTDAGCTYIQSTTSPAHTYPDGGLYEWDEAMQYSTTPGAQGICPSGWHIPTHDEWTTLERAVCTTGTCATDFPYDTSTVGYHGTDEGTKLKPGGSSGFEANIAGFVYGAYDFLDLRGGQVTLWSSSLNGSSTWTRGLLSLGAQVSRGKIDWELEEMGYSVRCLKDAPTTGMSGTITTNPDLERGLVGHWTFDGADVDWSSTTAEVRDRSGNGNHGNATTSYVPTPFTQKYMTTGVLGQAVNLGEPRTIDIPYRPILNIESPSTVASWVRVTDADSETFLWQVGYPPAIWSEISGLIIGTYLGALANERICFHVTSPDDDIGCYVNANANVLFDGSWHHIAWVADSSSYKIYLDGASVPVTMDQGTNDGTYLESASANSVRIGNIRLGSSETSFFDGDVDDFRIYNRALSADEVKRLYELGAATKIAETITTNPDLERGLVGHWTFDGEYMDWGSTTAEVRDRSGNANHGNALGGMTTRSNMQGMLGQAMGFDGNNSNEVNAGSFTSLNGVSALTFAFWYKLDDINGDIADGGVIYKNGSYAIYFEGPNMLHFGLWDDLYVSTDLINDNPIQPSIWTHVTATWDGSTMRLYFDGVAQASTASFTEASLPDGFNELLMGSAPFGSQYLYGALDDVRIYNRALSADEVRRLYDMGR